MSTLEKQPLFYDISAIKEIPILSVADRLGIAVDKKGKNYWCKVRDEKNPSVVLHPDRNSFYDFGNQHHGDVIRFVQYAQDSDVGTAIRYLGENFGLEPQLTKQEMVDRPLTNWEYAKIGLHGDMASKNLVFPIETASMNDLRDMSWYYRISLNDLQKEDPEMYRDLIERRAVPYVEDLRNSYYLAIWNRFELTYLVGGNSINAYRSADFRERFRKETAALNSAERILFRACKKAGHEPSQVLQHDPVDVLRQLLHGSLGISLGNMQSKDLEALAARLGCTVCEVSIPLSQYFHDRILSLGHAAEYRSKQVTLQYLSLDAPVIASVLEDIQRNSETIPEQQQQEQTPVAEGEVIKSRKEAQKNYEIQ